MIKNLVVCSGIESGFVCDVHFQAPSNQRVVGPIALA